METEVGKRTFYIHFPGRYVLITVITRTPLSLTTDSQTQFVVIVEELKIHL